MKTLVAYFSASGVTAGVAERLAKAIGADLHEIVPAQRYTAADLDWRNPDSRSSVEMKNQTIRPAVREQFSAEGYDAILVGFPIWWGVAPTVVNTFLEGCGTEGKIVVPFATSGGSGMRIVNAALAPSCRGAVLKEGKRFSPSASEAELRSWAESVLKQG